MYLVS
jgi:hypothetical protein